MVPFLAAWADSDDGQRRRAVPTTSVTASTTACGLSPRRRTGL